MRRHVEDRFLAKIVANPATGCWIWTGSLNAKGYGQFYDGEKVVLAHRFIYEDALGPIPADREIDHICRNRACVRLPHLEAVTHLENRRRAAVARTACANGHPYTPDTVRYLPSKEGRSCRLCRNARERARLARRRAEARA